ncbi:MAG: hypothetical protein U5K37_02795 [Natrialbaceae archaeon]|nr:hypothetical protein [Natrialbaceae archaeon]
MTGASSVRVVDAVALALIGGFVAGIAVGAGFANDDRSSRPSAPLSFGVTFALAYVRLSGVPDIRGSARSA